jgi:hypothetical protein
MRMRYLNNIMSICVLIHTQCTHSNSPNRPYLRPYQREYIVRRNMHANLTPRYHKSGLAHTLIGSNVRRCGFTAGFDPSSNIFPARISKDLSARFKTLRFPGGISPSDGREALKMDQYNQASTSLVLICDQGTLPNLRELVISNQCTNGVLMRTMSERNFENQSRDGHRAQVG